jgi:hypothetical protein
VRNTFSFFLDEAGGVCTPTGILLIESK